MAEDRFQKLKEKYVSVLNVLNRQDVRVEKLHLEKDKLYLRAVAPTDQARDSVWDAIKKVNPKYAEEIQADISVSPKQTASKPQPAQVAEAKATAATTSEQAAGQDTYTVQKGDTLSAIAKKFYGNANEYKRIFEANKDELKDPDKIYPGQVLKIPKAPSSKLS